MRNYITPTNEFIGAIAYLPVAHSVRMGKKMDFDVPAGKCCILKKRNFAHLAKGVYPESITCIK